MHQRVIVTGTVLLSAGMLLLAEPEHRQRAVLTLPQSSVRYALQPVGPRTCTMTVREESHPDWAQCPVEEQEFGREQ